MDGLAKFLVGTSRGRREEPERAGGANREVQDMIKMLEERKTSAGRRKMGQLETGIFCKAECKPPGGTRPIGP